MSRILVVDDERSVFIAAKKALAPLKMEVDYASDGRRALQQIGQETYELLVIDLVMPAKSGFDLVTTLRGQGISIPVVIVSGVTTEDIRRELGRYSNLEFLQKPVKPADLLALAKKLLPPQATS